MEPVPADPLGPLGPATFDLHALPTHLYPARPYGGPALPARKITPVRTKDRRGRLTGPGRLGLPLRRTPVQAVLGPAGAGKTLTALGSSYTGGHNWDPYLWSYTDIHWVSARDEGTLEAGLLNVLRTRGVGPQDLRAARRGGTPIEDLVLARLVPREHPWMLILDGLDDPRLLADAQAPGGILRAGIPRSPGIEGGRIVVTSRITDPAAWGRWISLRQIEPWRSERAVELLQLHTGAQGAHASELGALAGRLRNLPLALRLAGRYLHAVGPDSGTGHALGIRDLRSAFEERHVQLFGTDHTAGAGLPADVAVLCDLSLDLLADRGLHHARVVLHVLGQLGPQPVPIAFLDLASTVGLPSGDGPAPVRSTARDAARGRQPVTGEQLHAALDGLGDLGLVHVRRTHVETDPLVVEAVRATTARDPGEDRAVLGVVADLLDLAVRSIDADAADQAAWWPALAPHLNAVADAARRTDPGQTLRLHALADVVSTALHRAGHQRSAHLIASTAAPEAGPGR
ncbi:hypothetical protein [Kitasatospora paranensis]|uniref:NB-ARC domain-containing protein n=1 Tax=Kitasatospora paranensis TaxID=258053 RepID=A0ABW2FRJ3_9ACTN